MGINIGPNRRAILAQGHTPALASGKVDLSPSFVVSADSLLGAVSHVYAAGTARTLTITFAGTYAAGDIVKVTIVDNSESRQIWRKQYQYTVVAGDTVTTIANAVEALIDADTLAPYTASNVAGVLTITASQTLKNSMVGYVYADSTAGTIAYVVGVAGTVSSGTPAQAIVDGISADLITNSTFDVVVIQYNPSADQNFTDGTVDGKSMELVWYGDAGEGAALTALINAL
jgi:phage tail sheath gpL-like